METEWQVRQQLYRFDQRCNVETCPYSKVTDAVTKAMIELLANGVDEAEESDGPSLGHKYP